MLKALDDSDDKKIMDLDKHEESKEGGGLPKANSRPQDSSHHSHTILPIFG